MHRLEAKINRAVKLPEVAAQMAAIQISPVASSSEELAKILATDLARWGVVAQSARSGGSSRSEAVIVLVIDK